MEPSEFCLAQEPVEDVAHFMEECHDIIVAHESRFVGCGLGKIGDHSRQWVAAFPVRAVVSR